MKLLVGLGNPGPRYRGTYHNVGFDVVDEIARRHGVAFGAAPAEALAARWRGEAGDVWLVKPLTFMNSSGEAVAQILRKRGLGPEALVVVVDDVDLELGRLRIREKGSPGGHNGLKSVQACLGADAYVRVRVGVGRPRDGRQMVGHVLSRYAPDEREAAEAVILRAADAIEAILGEGLAKAMNGFNG